MKPQSLKQLTEISYSLDQLDQEKYSKLINEINEKIANILRLESPTSSKFRWYDYAENERKSIRKQMTGIYHEAGYKVASDGHILIAMKEQYPEDYEGKILKKDGSFVDESRKYPNWRNVIPKREITKDKRYTDVEIDFEKWKEIYDKYKAEKKLGLEWKYVFLNNHFFQVELFNKLINFMKHIDCKTLTLFERMQCNWDTSNTYWVTGACTVGDIQGDYVGVLMPCYVDKEIESYKLL
jgi:hypothetical protein